MLKSNRFLGFVICAALLSAVPAHAKEAAGYDFPEQTQVAGQQVSLVGTGVRTKWMLTIYGMGVYTKTPKKQAAWLVSADEPKMLWLHMARSIAAEKMRDTIDQTFTRNTPAAERAPMMEDLEKIKAAFPDPIGKGLDIRFIYSPEKGTTLRLGNVDKVTVPGSAFMRAIWRIWFGHSPADSGLTEEILGK